jgi:hypothetical protein
LGDRYKRQTPGDSTPGVHMSDKPRHRTRAPHGSVPNWVLFVFLTAAVALAGFANSIVL